MSQLVDVLTRDPDFASSAPGAGLRATPLGFVDVGARGGVHEIVSPLASLTAVLGFEPAHDECARLRAELAANSPWARCEVEEAALDRDERVAELFVLSAPTNSSLRRPNVELTERYAMAKWAVVGRVPVRTTTLDTVLFGSRAREGHWGEVIKLDTQGTEYEILEGATRTLSERALAVVCEVSFCELYVGQRLFSEVEMLLRGHGFSFYGFSAMHHRSQRALDKRTQAGRERSLYADAVFLKDPLPGGPAVARPILRQLYVLFVASLLLGYGDFALELACRTWAQGAERARIERLVRRWTSRPPAAARADALSLAARVQANPTLAAVEVGRFVDARRGLCDYDDVAPVER